MGRKEHIVCIPFPAQGHINPMLKLSKLLHFNNGFQITFINTKYNHNRLLRSTPPQSLSPEFSFHVISDGLSDDISGDSTQDIPSLCNSTTKTCFIPFKNIIQKLNSGETPVTGIIADAAMVFTVAVADELVIPIALLWTVSACGALAYMHIPSLLQNGLLPLQDSKDLTNGYLETKVDWIPSKNTMPLKAFPSFIRTTNPDDIMMNYLVKLVEQAPKASIGIILNTFETLETQVLSFLSTMLPNIFTIGPLHLLNEHHLTDQKLSSINVNLWKEDEECLQWLDSKEPTSVLYVNFGSITVMNQEQLIELAWGLANSQMPFLWVIRPDLVAGESAGFPPEFTAETEGRSMIVRWCPQEKVLKHPAIGGFLTHSGWNSTLESISSGVPMICWPFFAEQQMNCRHCCTDWGVGMEIENDKMKRDEVEKLVRALMEGEKGRELRKKAAELKVKAEEAIKPGGSSFMNLEKLVYLLSNNKNMVV